MDSFYVTFPPYMSSVIDTLIERNWFITYYDAEINDIYNPANYLYNIRVEHLEYKLVPDRNILTYILQSIHKDKCTDHTRDSIGLILFCQFCEINIEPNLAVHEYINFDTTNIDKAVDEIEIFRAIDNYSEQAMLDYYIGTTNLLPIHYVSNINKTELKESLAKITWLKEWDSLYLITLKLTDIAISDKSNELKLEEFVLWMSQKYRRSLVAFMFAIYLFSENRIADMIKYRLKDNKEKKVNSLKNMAWDLYYMNSAFRIWQEKKDHEEYIFASNDRVIQIILSKAIRANKSGNFEVLKNEFHKKEYDNIDRLFKFSQTNENRIYNSQEWSEKYRDQLIVELEKKLLRN